MQGNFEAAGPTEPLSWFGDQQSKICSACAKWAKGDELAFAKGRPYHKECMKCAACGDTLTASTLFSRAGKLWCQKHKTATEVESPSAGTSFAVTCTICAQSVGESSAAHTYKGNPYCENCIDDAKAAKGSDGSKGSRGSNRRRPGAGAGSSKKRGSSRKRRGGKNSGSLGRKKGADLAADWAMVNKGI